VNNGCGGASGIHGGLETEVSDPQSLQTVYIHAYITAVVIRGIYVYAVKYNIVCTMQYNLMVCEYILLKYNWYIMTQV